MRLDRHPVLRTQNIEIKGRHQGRHGCTAGLMAANLDAVAFRTQMVGIMDRPA